ncbi:YncE family protein [Paracoccus sp. IB05]|uniref:YncE family protein n=1 Tax=Paracoccus sp. IB05 TaxID=2779367 RepID=UPI0018E8B9E9|nr:YncE family protein [Paracoccus sp. IB05]MBJ2149274.1 YncE family protein [Paracoccus sp. IB05]
MTFLSRRGLVLAMLLFTASPLLAEGIPQMQPAEFAPAATRTSAIPGGYEVLSVPELGAVFAASVPDFTDGAAGDVYMLDADTLAPIRRIQLKRRPFALAVDHARGLLYAGNTKDGSLSVIDARSGLFLRMIQLGKTGANGKMEHTRMIEVDQATGRVFVTGPTDEGIVWIIDGATGEVTSRTDKAVIWAAGLAFDGRDRLYVGGGGAEEILVLNAETGEKITTFSTGDTAPGQGDKSAHFMVNLSLDAAGGRLFAVDSHEGRLYVFNTADGSILAQVPIGPGALDVIWNPLRDEAYVTWYGINSQIRDGTGGITVVNTKDYSVTRDLAVKTFPSNLALDESGQVLFASVSEPSNDKHPDHAPGTIGSVIRLDLAILGDLMAAKTP